MSKAEIVFQGGLVLCALQGLAIGDPISTVVMGGLAWLTITLSRAERRDRDQWK